MTIDSTWSLSQHMNEMHSPSHTGRQANGGYQYWESDARNPKAITLKSSADFAMSPQSLLQLLQQRGFIFAQLHVSWQVDLVGFEQYALGARLKGNVAQLLLQGALTVHELAPYLHDPYAHKHERTC